MGVEMKGNHRPIAPAPVTTSTGGLKIEGVVLALVMGMLNFTTIMLSPTLAT